MSLEDLLNMAVTAAEEQHEGAGVRVHRPFPSPKLASVNPFLLLDETGPNDFAPGQAVGFPDHSHHGFESITYIYMSHGGLIMRDSGNNLLLLVPVA